VVAKIVFILIKSTTLTDKPILLILSSSQSRSGLLGFTGLAGLSYWLDITGLGYWLDTKR
jgi:hypothetical protein